MNCVVSLIEPNIACTTCATNDLVSEVYDVLYDIEQDEKLTVGVGGSFFGYVKGFKMNEEDFDPIDYVKNNHIRIDEHLLYGHQAEFVIIGKDVFYTMDLDKQSYESLFNDYEYYYAVGLEIGGHTLEHLVAQ